MKKILFPIACVLALGNTFATELFNNVGATPYTIQDNLKLVSTKQATTNSATSIAEQNTNYINFITVNNITSKVDSNFKFKSLTAAEYKHMAVQYAEIDIPNSLLMDKSKFFTLLQERYLINKYGPEDFDTNREKYTKEFMYYLNKPLAVTKNDQKSQLRVGLFNEENGIKIIVPTNEEGVLPKSMITAYYGISPTNETDSLLTEDPTDSGFVNVIKDGKNNPGLLWTGLSDSITTDNYKYVLDQVEYSAGKSIADMFKGTRLLSNEEIRMINAVLFNDKALLDSHVEVPQPSSYLAQIANVRYKKYEKEVIIPELKKFTEKYIFINLDSYISADGTFKTKDEALDYQALHEVEAEYIAYMYNDMDNKPTNTTEIKKKAIHIHNMIQAMQMFGDANTRVSRTLYYAYLFKHNMNPGVSFKDFAPIMGDNPIYKANLKMLDTIPESQVTDFMLATFSKSQPKFSINNFTSHNVIENVSNILNK